MVSMPKATANIEIGLLLIAIASVLEITVREYASQSNHASGQDAVMAAGTDKRKLFLRCAASATYWIPENFVVLLHLCR